MEIFIQPQDLRARVRSWRMNDERVAFVPTMGNLHSGHGDLVMRARNLAHRVVVSVFVNPTQFGPNEDYAQYPRTPDEDRALLEKIGADALFVPEVAGVYPEGHTHSTIVDVPELSGILCGEFRPGHFRGVATVVVKLLNIVAPDVALFGEKDYQQLTIIRRATVDLCLPVEIVGVPTVREPNGLAMSSRNRYLTAQDRIAAPRIFAALDSTRRALQAGDRDFAALEQAGKQSLIDAGFKVDYFAIRDTALQATPINAREYVVLTAARIGRARLIDNVRAVI
jgi:pantoate--beta-alanine ligase